MKSTKLFVLNMCVSASLAVPAFSPWSAWSASTCTTDTSPASPTVVIDSGPIVGTVASLGAAISPVNEFLGVPFAKPPVGDLRFAPPQQPNNWTCPRPARSLPPSCLQDFGNATSGRVFQMDVFNTPPPPNGESEDCLYLNVYAPAGGSPSKAVFFWIYGGGFQFGANSLPMYNGTSFAANQDVIVVTTNYRTNVFGYPRSPQLALDAQNLGHLDQRLALDWVQRNIHAFGGDPKKVTIAGESAGAVSVGDLLTTMPENPPFQAAVLESGTAIFAIPPNPPNNNTEPWDVLMKLLNCTSTSDAEVLACARAANASDIEAVVSKTNLPFTYPVTDNITRLQDPFAAYVSGAVAKVPILAGSNFNDGTAFAHCQNNLTQFLSTLDLGTQFETAVEKLYAPGAPGSVGLTSQFEIIAKIITDSTFLCPANLMANLTETGLKMPAWLYLFDAEFANTQFAKYPRLGVYHSSEIRMVFGTYPTVNATKAEEQLSAAMQKAWGDFVNNPSKGPGWKAFPEIEVLGTNGDEAALTTANVTSVEEICAEWDKVYAVLAKLQA